MGLMLANILDTFEVPMDTTVHRPTVEEIRWLNKKGDSSEIGKNFEFNDEQLNCCSKTEKEKLKSGKYVKSNLKKQWQEQWPHVNVLHKYVKWTTFEQMEFEAFVAGEARIIQNMEKNGNN